ncbi:hypothetical protein P8807_10020 [Bacillus subtilis]|uniref:Actin-like protein N-terminal domain-containing protein n=2 Tax=Bacillus subtilis TaxID=1423 RepID=A0A0D1KDX8_BACIU|nr:MULTISPECIES: hypothetical protein [Bacillus subtilis group]AVB12084.1 hypothetical protein C3438_21725 [Bacillus velezensis]AYK76601.1 hypothetical protein D9C12_22930 [Bacillus subtilis subsp. subtilis]AYL03231.1 hypothetical protein D9C08_23085 [Bacillus subtilis subsp. subtilis]KIU04447.1 hypothetical protein SC09_contig8orf00091 [Bacillus subtilis]MCT6515473.1 hypothetical protein [Bacillus subtilis]
MPDIMTENMLKIAVDVGSSENRTLDCTDFGQKNKLVNSNDYIRVSEETNYQREIKYEKLPFSEKLHLKITKLHEDGKECTNEVANRIINELKQQSFLIGAATKFDRSGKSEKMLSQQFKHQQFPYYLNVIAGITMVMNERGVTTAQIKLKTLFPPNELTPNNAPETEEIAKGVLCGTYKVKNLLTGQTFEFSIVDEDYEVLEEMKMALARLLSTEAIKLDDDDDVDAEQMEEIINENTLLFIDIGNSTTNVSIFEDGKYQPKSNETFTQLNGNVLLQYVGNSIKQAFTTLPEINTKDAIKALETGKMKIGRGKKDVTEAVQQAITKFSSELYNKIRTDYFTNKGIASYNIAYLLVSGGGSVAPENVDNTARELHRLFQNEETFDEEGIGLLIVDIDKGNEENPEESVRDLNVNGAGDFFDLEYIEEAELEPQG